MDPKDFQDSPVGSLLPIAGDQGGQHYKHVAFLPADLPKTLPLQERTYSAVADAAVAAGRLDAAAMRLPNPAILVRPAMYGEAVSTSALEGTYAPLVDVLGGALVEERLRSQEVREILNYVRAAEQAIDLLSKKPICVTMLQELQATLVRGTRGDGASSGKLRGHQVFIGKRGQNITSARFVPPPPGAALEAGIYAWEAWINETHEMPTLVKAALAHYQFETLHPFNDGNGRLGRLVILLQLLEAEILAYPILNLSEWLEPRKDEYTGLLLEVSKTGAWDPWVVFFATAIKEQCAVAMARIDTMLAIREDIVSALKSVNNRGLLVTTVVDDLVAYPVVTPTQIAKEHGVTYAAARSAITKLTELGFLEEITGRSYGMMFGCPQLMAAIEGHL